MVSATRSGASSSTECFNPGRIFSLASGMRVAHRPGHARGRSDIVLAGHDQGGTGDLMQPIDEIVPGKDGIGGRVAGRVVPHAAGLARLDHFGMGRGEGVAEPTLDRLAEMGSRAAFAQLLCALQDPLLLFGRAIRHRTHDRQGAHLRRVAQRERLRDQPAQREADKVEAGPAELLDQRFQIGDEVVHRVGAGHLLALAMAAKIVAEAANRRAQPADHAVPAFQMRSDAMDENHPPAGGLALEPDVRGHRQAHDARGFAWHGHAFRGSPSVANAGITCCVNSWSERFIVSKS